MTPRCRTSLLMDGRSVSRGKVAMPSTRSLILSVTSAAE